MEDYSVESVFFESVPGFFVTGNLYRPKNAVKKIPAILCPYGHFRNGRFLDNDQKTVAEMIARGEESEPSNARSPLQAHCVHLARMGCVVFHYDMIGYADSTQIPYEVAHFSRNRREQDNNPEGWLFFSPRAEMQNQSIMGLQTWNSIRALDLVQSLDDVDRERIGVTGCSGGGTQTFILAALDERVKAAFAAAMVSTGMQGGCTCENACNLRTITGNVEIAAMFAPKPMGLSAANDWTKTMPMDGYPQLQQLWQMLDTPENVFLAPSLTMPHGYNQHARRAMYAWFNRHLKIVDDPHQLSVEQVFAGDLPTDSIYAERPFEFLDSSKLTVWNDVYPRPEPSLDVERSVTKWWAETTSSVPNVLLWNDQTKVLSRHLLGHPDANPADALRSEPAESPASSENEEIQVTRLRIFNESDCLEGYQVSLCQLPPVADSNEPSRRAPLVFLIGDFEREDSISLKIRDQVLSKGLSIVAIDSKQLQKRNQLNQSQKEIASFTFGYNRTSLAKDARMLAWAIEHYCGEMKPPHYWIISPDQTIPAVAVAAACVQGESPEAIILAKDFSFHSVDNFQDPNFFPGALMFGDLQGFLKIAKPKKIVFLEIPDSDDLSSAERVEQIIAERLK
jgi:dienelactone hydrolase